MTNYSPDLTITMLLKLGTGIIMTTFCPIMPNFTPIMPTFCQLLCYMHICPVPKTFLGQVLSTSCQHIEFCSPPKGQCISIFRVLIKAETCPLLSHLYCYPIFACQSPPGRIEVLLVYLPKNVAKEWFQCFRILN